MVRNVWEADPEPARRTPTLERRLFRKGSSGGKPRSKGGGFDIMGEGVEKATGGVLDSDPSLVGGEGWRAASQPELQRSSSSVYPSNDSLRTNARTSCNFSNEHVFIGAKSNCNSRSLRLITDIS